MAVSDQAAPHLACDIALEFSDRVNFAMQQNGVPLVDTIRLTLRNVEAVDDLLVELNLDNGDAEAWRGRVASLSPDTTISLSPDSFGLSARNLATRTEAERSAIVCRVSSAEGEVKRSFPVELLAFDQWPGVGHYAELTAAFVTPNHPRIAEVLIGARQNMGDLSGSDALDGYQSGSRQRASHLAEACFNALASRGIGYINPPASFESAGQRVRLVDRIAKEGMGTCLDLSLFLAGLWEQCGLHALVLLPEGHAFPAVWTHEAHLPETVIDEPARIRNLIELGEVIPVESTLITQQGASFASAVAAAKERLRSPGSVFHAIDIRSSRKRGVRPLPLRDDGESGVDLGALRDPAPVAASSTTIDAVSLADRAEARQRDDHRGEPSEAPSDRISRWQTRLLDLSLRNRLINFRPSGRSLVLAIPDLPGVEDKLAGGARFRVLPRESTDEAFLREELKAGHLRSDATQAETQKRLLNLFRIAKSSIEETGANVLYLALGFLKWYESETSETERLAPLILLPITLIRNASGGGYSYTLSLSDEPLRPNVTLLEKLRVEFGIETEGLDDLPEDESGIDVPLILRSFRSAIRDMPRWEVEATACLGLFSFNKFLMWKDLQDNFDRLKESRLVDRLVSGSAEPFDPSPFPRPEELDKKLAPDDLLCTRDADSSQLAAIRAAAEGRTFVLEGPPGTGKSQTIANIIADTLARGQRVLFVAEKMAALSVVRKRLEDDGLGPFCLELHSAKASKKQVLAQLEESLDAEGSRSPRQWDALCRDLQSTRDRLNEYVREMHTPRNTGESLYRVLGRLSLIGDGPSVPPPTESPAETTAEQLDTWKRAVAELQQRTRPVDPPAEFPLRGIGRAEWSFSLPTEARSAIEAATGTLQGLSDATRAFLVEAGVPADPDSLGQQTVHALVKAADELQKCPTPDRRLIDGPDAKGLREQLLGIVTLGRERDGLRSGLLARYREEFLGVDPLVHLDAIQRHLKQPALLRLFTAAGVKKALRIYAAGDLPPLDEVARDLESVRVLKGLEAKLGGDAARAAGRHWNGGDADWDQIEAMVAWSERFSKLLGVIGRDAAAGGLADALAGIASGAGEADRVRSRTRDIINAWNTWAKAWGELKSTLVTDSRGTLGDSAEGWMAALAGVFERWNTHLGDLNTWCTWRQARDAAASTGLGELVDLYERGGCDIDEIEDVFWRSFGQAWFTEVADGVDAVRTFNADAHGDAIARFRRLDTESIELTRDVVAAKLAAAAPSTPSSAAPQSELGILRRELEKQRRHLPTRRLIESMPNLLPRLKPCFLMSPLSVAQYLDTALKPFDLVVFDEASQIPVWDAIGAIARGTGVVVVGDSKQLPPTAFFSTLDGDDDAEPEDGTVEDMESILKECNASGIPGMRLKWHYRSRHESLIAFSNYHYYQNELHTFPSPDERSDELGVTFRHVEDGVYDRGGSRTNRVEATRVVDDVVRMLRDASTSDSIGIVTFNQAQQRLIEDLLDERRREHPEIEPYFTNEVSEPVFVKNLENVQGDERDAIIFSVGYGPDQTGKPSMNFGPLNKDGGERRLNVAVTRARRRLIVFSSLTSDQIDLRRTRAVGVKHFKTFLDYADRGTRAIAEAVSVSGSREFDSGFEQAVWRALTDRGWEVDTQVGCAGYRIDLAVRHPEKPGKYLLGIECDGAPYHSAKNARDRDRLRQSVLEGLGWRIERVWSTDWRINPTGCLDKLIRAIERSLQAPEDPVLPEDRPVITAEEPDEIASVEEEDGEVGNAGVSEEAEAVLYAGGPASPVPAPVTHARSEVYVAAEDLGGRLGGLDVYDPTAKVELIKALVRIVEIESPLTEELAVRRLAGACGVQRVTERFRKRFKEVRTAATRAGSIRTQGEVLWKSDQGPAGFRSFRAPGETEAARRGIEDVPIVEIANVAAVVLREQFGLPREDLVREVARELGARRTTARMSERIGQAIDQLIAAGRADEENDKVSPVDG